MLIDSSGRIAPSQITESVQLRITTSAKAPSADAGGLAGHPKHATAQEFELRRADLFAGATGGLRDVSEEHDFMTGFSAHPVDEFEVDRRGTHERFPLQPFQVSPSTRRQTCFGCHAVSNIYDTRSFQRSWSQTEVLNASSPPMYPVAAMEVQTVEREAVHWKETHSDWARLRQRMQK